MMKLNDDVGERISDAPMTVREAYLRAASVLQQKAIAQDPRRVSEWLILSLLDWNRTELFLRWDEPFPQQKIGDWKLMLERKIKGEPVQYIIGEQQFMGLEFTVSPDVLIPRPETEILVEHMLHLGTKLAEERGRNATVTIADVGTGSGAIPVSMAVQRPDWSFYATDISSAALAGAQLNAKRHSVDDQITWLSGDLLLPLSSMSDSIDMLVSNPPYIPTEELASLAREVGEFEPNLALDGGEDGLQCYRKIVRQMNELCLAPQLLGFEIGIGQADAVMDMLDASMTWSRLEAIPDLTGRMRHVIGVK